MPFIIGMILGEALARIGFFRALGAMLLLGTVGFVSYRLVHANIDPAYAYATGAAAPTALFVWAIWHPAASRTRLWIVDGVYLAARLSMWLMVLGMILTLLSSGFHLDIWVSRGWSFALVAAVLWTVQWLLRLQTARSDRIMGDRSVV